MNLTTPVKELFLIGPVYARRLKKLGIETAEDLLYYFPFRYQDYSLVTPIGTMQEGEVVTIRGRIVTSQNNYTRRGFNLQKIKIDDGSGQADAIWFNRPFLVNSWRVGQSLSLAGKVERLGKRWVLKSPDCEIGTSYIHTGRLVPVYHETAGISSRWLRSRIANLLNQNLRIKEFLPVEGWLEINQALKQIHFPADLTKAQAARKRFAFEELLRLQLQVWQRKKRWQGKRLAFQFKKLPFLLDNFEKSLPFALTSAQKRVIEEIQQDLTKQQPMNRLLVGDVGSGKTVVAATAILTTAKNNLQAAIMAPTEILAQQHYETLTQLLKPWGVKIDLLTSSTHNTQPVTRNPQFDLIIGTQALLYRQHLFEKLGLLVVDEQHRFGVEQRGQLLKQAATPHLLTMTATPIPRSVALTLHGDLDLSLLDELPPGRQKIKTWVVPEKKRPAAYRWLKKQLREKAQVFVVCPLIEESEKETMKSIKAATGEAGKLKLIFGPPQVGLLHGQLPSKEKKKVLGEFQAGKKPILVATPVVEAGIDIPQATIIIIEAAERFGLAQLHQLRGRVGRNKQAAYCLLFSSQDKENARLRLLEKTEIGFQLAEADLKIRGPGEIYGTQQHGFVDLKVANWNDLELIEKSRQTAALIGPKLAHFPVLKDKIKEDTILLA